MALASTALALASTRVHDDGMATTLRTDNNDGSLNGTHIGILAGYTVTADDGRTFEVATGIRGSFHVRVRVDGQSAEVEMLRPAPMF